MKNSKKILLSFAFLFIFSILTVSCNDSDNDNSYSGTSRLKVSLTDSPGDYDEVNIDVVDVKIKSSNDTGEDGWVSVGNITPGVYNLLELTGGITAILADNDIPSGYLGQIRLVLGDNNTVVIDGVSHHLDTPSGQQSGLKLQVNETLMPDVTYNFLLDFDVDKSIVSAGNSGKYILKPVIRVITELAPGSIKGTVTPLGFQVTASVVVDGAEVTANTDENGVFVLHGIPAGTYTVTLTPDPLSTFAPKTIENVVVVDGMTTDTGTTNLEVAPGSIKGTVSPLGFQVTASVIVNGTAVTANTNETGVFVLNGIPAGTYTVTLTPDVVSGFTPKTIENVVVVNGVTTDTGTTTFP